MNISKELLLNPSMTEYIANQADSNFVKKTDNGEKKPFGANTKRFTEKE